MVVNDRSIEPFNCEKFSVLFFSLIFLVKNKYKNKTRTKIINKTKQNKSRLKTFLHQQAVVFHELLGPKYVFEKQFLSFLVFLLPQFSIDFLSS